MKKIFLVLLFLFMGPGFTYATGITTNPFPPQNSIQTKVLDGALPGAITFTQSLDTSTITPSLSVSCNAGGFHSDNSYIRRFDLSTDHGITESFSVTGVTIGIEFTASAGGTGQPATVNLYTIPAGSPLIFANLTPIGQTVLTDVPDLSTTLFEIEVTGTITDPQTQNLVVEIFTPNGQSANNSFFIGSNANGQTAPSYIAAATCGLTEPTDLATPGFPNMHILMIVHGDASAAIPTLSEWGSILLVMLLAGTAYLAIRRRQTDLNLAA